MRFKQFSEYADIFGFDSKKPPSNPFEDQNPVYPFDIELMSQFLSRRKIGLFESNINFMNEVQWGDRYGAIKLNVDPRFTFHIRRLGFDLDRSPRWVTKKLFQLNRQGYGGYEESVAGEIYDEIERIFNYPLEVPTADFQKLEDLTMHITTKMRRTAKPYFVFEHVRKLNNDNYIIKFNVGSQGVEAPDHQRVEEVLTQVMYDRQAGMLRVTNYKVESKVGGPRSWTLKPSDLDLFFFPNQDRDEIAEAIAVRWKYY